MELNYPSKSNGMYILSRYQIDDIATMILLEYMPSVLENARPVDIEALVEDHLYLMIQNQALGFGSSILGITAFEDVEDLPCLDDMYQPIKIGLPAGTILIHSCLLGYQNKARRRYTIAHECSHWILHRTYYSPVNQQYKLRTQRLPYVACRSANIERKQHDLISDSDWEEWQADTLAAALLMPLAPFKLFANRLICKGRRQYLPEKVTSEYIEIVEEIADKFTVSKQAAEIRLKHLGMIKKERSFSYL